MNLLRTILLVLLIPFGAFTQIEKDKLEEMLANDSEQELVATNSELMMQGYYYQASLICDKLLTMQPNSPNYHYRRGFIYLEMSQDFEKAIPHLEIAVTNTDKNYDMFSANEQSAPVDAIYFMAKAYHMAMQIDKAEQYYNKFIAESSNKSEYVFFSKLYLQQTAVARNLIAIPRKVTLKNVGYQVNTSSPEYSPVISLDGSALYFTARRPWDGGRQTDDDIDKSDNLPPEDIYVAFKDFDGEWTDPYRLEFSDPHLNEATVAVSSDERRIYLYSDTVGNGDIFYSDFSSNKFQDIKHYEAKKVNTDSWETHCTVTPDGQNMYFVSDRKGGFGGRDIYRVVKLPNGEWSEPQNCGPKINGPMDEESPFIAIDNKTLYFSSNGSTSMGGFDVFVAVRDENNEWSDPINLGYPLNSTVDDLFYTTTVDGLTGYLTSARSGGYGEKDIYEIQNDYMKTKSVLLDGQIVTLHGAKMPEDISVSIVCTNCGDRLERKVFPRLRDGVFYSALEPCREYDLVYSYDKGQKEFYKQSIKTDCAKDDDVIHVKAYLDVENQNMFTPYYIVGTVKDSKSKQLLTNVSVNLTNKTTGVNYTETQTNEKGGYRTDTLTSLNKGEILKMQLVLQKPGYVTMTFDVDVELGDQAEIDIDKLIEPLLASNEIGTDIGMFINPIYFDYNKWDIRPDAAAELDKIVEIMKNNPGIKIELGSHTDSRGTAEYNMSLSDKRAKSSAAYIVSKGISADRIKGKGYGESRLKVSDKIIKALPTWEQQEVEHQKNRRTEFLIVK